MKNYDNNDEYVVADGVWEDSMQVRMRPTLSQQPTKVTSGVNDFPVCVPCYASRPNVRCAIRWASGMILVRGVKWPVQANILAPQNSLSLKEKAFRHRISPRRSDFLCFNGRYFALQSLHKCEVKHVYNVKRYNLILVQRRLCRERNLKFGPKCAPEVTYFGNKCFN